MKTRNLAIATSMAAIAFCSARMPGMATGIPAHVNDAEEMFDPDKSNPDYYTPGEIVDEAVDGFDNLTDHHGYEDVKEFLEFIRNEYGSVAGAAYKKSRTISGICYDADDNVYGTITIKTGAINKNRKTVKLKATVAPFSGKKSTASVIATPDEDGSIYGVFNFKSPVGAVEFDISGYDDGSGNVALCCQGYGENGHTIYDIQPGGAFDSDMLYFSADGDFDLGDDWEMVVDVPDGEPIYVKNGTKFSFDKAPSIKYKKFREDGDTWYELTGLDDDAKTNYSALKLTYTAKTGVFKGSFKIYASNECCTDGKPKLKTYTAKVNGVAVGGAGYGTATVKIGKTTQTVGCRIDE